MPLAAIRADEINFPLLLHVLGAMALVGMLFTAGVALLAAWRRSEGSDAVALTRFGFWSLIAGVVPSWILMRIGAGWTASEEFPGDEPEVDWLGIGYVTAELGGLLILVSLVLSIIGLRRTREGASGSATIARIVGVVAVVVLLAYVVAVWAMTTKPT